MKNANKDDNNWDVFLYEVYMYFYMYVRVYNSKLNTNGPRNRAINNSYVESLLLHTRILTQIFLFKRKGQQDDIKLNQLLDPKEYSDTLNSLINKLDVLYHNKTKNSPKVQIDKLLVHATHLRTTHHNYDKLISILHPTLLEIINEIQLFTKDKTIKKHMIYYLKNMKSYITTASTH